MTPTSRRGTLKRGTAAAGGLGSVIGWTVAGGGVAGCGGEVAGCRLPVAGFPVCEPKPILRDGCSTGDSVRSGRGLTGNGNAGNAGVNGSANSGFGWWGETPGEPLPEFFN